MREKLTQGVTLLQFVGIIIPALVALGMAMSYMVEAHARIPYHPGILTIAYEKGRGEVLEQKIKNIENNQLENNKLLKEILEEVKK